MLNGEANRRESSFLSELSHAILTAVLNKTYINSLWTFHFAFFVRLVLVGTKDGNCARTSSVRYFRQFSRKRETRTVPRLCTNSQATPPMTWSQTLARYWTGLNCICQITATYSIDYWSEMYSVWLVLLTSLSKLLQVWLGHLRMWFWWLLDMDYLWCG